MTVANNGTTITVTGTEADPVIPAGANGDYGQVDRLDYTTDPPTRTVAASTDWPNRAALTYT